MADHRSSRQRGQQLPRKTARRPLLLLFFLLPLIPPGCNSMPQGDPADGERWYRLHHCDGCHGEDGTGGRGPELAPTELSFRRFVRKVRSPGSTIMPAYDPQRLPDEDAADIYLWLRSRMK